MDVESAVDEEDGVESMAEVDDSASLVEGSEGVVVEGELERSST